jgi:TrmH family RNA methyltransferase
MSVISITSAQNPHIKDIALVARKTSKKTGQFVIEGVREVERAIKSGVRPIKIFFCDTLLTEDAKKIIEQLSKQKPTPIQLSLSQPLFAKIAMRENRDGLVVLCETPKTKSLVDLKMSANTLLLVVDAVEKPGNIGAMLRSADGAGVLGVVLLGDAIDLYNPQLIRASLGTVFNHQIAFATREDFLKFAKTHDIKIIVADPDASADYYSARLIGRTAVVVGSEDQGVDQSLLESPLVETVKIPMAGIADSLNVSVAAAIMLYEARRQRQSQ